MKRIYWLLFAVVPLALLFMASRTSRSGAKPVVAAQEEPARIRAEGRVVSYPGAEVTVSSEAIGRIVYLEAQEQSKVRAGETLVELDVKEETAAIAEASATLLEARAGLAYQMKDFERKERLWGDRVVSEDLIDQSRRDRDAAAARVSLAEAAVARLEAARAKHRMASPIDGVVLQRMVDPGEMVDLGDPLLRVVDLSRLRIEAEVDEYDANRVRLGARATITIEGAPGTEWPGVVEEVPDAVTLRGLRPQDPGRPTDTGVLLVKIALEDPGALKLGQRVEVEISKLTP